MRFSFILILFILLINKTVSGQANSKVTISGFVKDKNTGEALFGAGIVLIEINKGSTANEFGFYSITVNPGKYVVTATYLGYQTQKDTIDLTKDVRLNYKLQTLNIEQKEVVITAERSNDNTRKSEMGTISLSIDKIKTLPVFMGEVDILKTLQLLPGIQSAGEGNSGFYVRGGGPDQNLVLLDDAVVYNPGHLFGFFSIFNSDALNNATIIKGGMPAEYGGRLSSVVNINMKEGNSERFTATGGVGLIASRLTLEGPIQKGKSSFMLSGRRTYIDILTKPFVNPESNFAGSGYFFYDLNTKLNYQFSEKDRIYLSGYFGRDKFTFKGENFDFTFPWGNTTATFRWNHLFNNKLFLNTTALFSDYNFSFNAGQNNFDFKLFSGVRDYNLKADFEYFPNSRNQIKFGLNYIFHVFTPSTATGSSGDVDFSPEKINKQYANEAAIYIQDDFELNKRIKFNAGIRYSAFQQIGPYDRFVENINGEISDTISYKPGKNIAFYHAPEPRFTARYQLNEFSSIKGSFTRTFQYLNLASTTGSTLPTDIWVPSSQLVKPQKSTLYAVGYFRNFLKDLFESSVEVYYKSLQNQIEFEEGATFGFNNNIENEFVFGKGESYGIEFFLKKRTGKFNGWVGYTLSYTTRQFDDLQEGKSFYAKYDRRHDLSVVLQYELSKKWTFGSIFVFGSGSAFSLPAGYFFVGNTPSFYFENDYRNKYRLTPYHRLDISATYYSKKTATRESSWNFSFYNVYNRYNQYLIYFSQEGSLEEGNLTTKARQVSIFPIIPAVTWNYKF